MLIHELLTNGEPADGVPLFVLLHGRGANRHDLLGLLSWLPEGSILVAPEAPHDAAPWGYGPGSAWYRFLGENRPEPESFEQSQLALEDLLAGLPGHLPVTPGTLVLGGFSQGGTMCLAYALRHPGEVPYVVDFSGFIPEHPSVEVSSITVAGTAFFWGHGTLDPSVPFEWARRGRALLTEAGADLEAHDYPIGHWIAEEELIDFRAWLDDRLSS